MFMVGRCFNGPINQCMVLECMLLDQGIFIICTCEWTEVKCLTIITRPGGVVDCMESMPGKAV